MATKYLNILALFPLSLFLACSSDASSGFKNPESDGENISTSSWSIKAYKKSENSNELVSFSIDTKLKSLPGLKTKSTSPLVSAIENDTPSTIEALNLLQLAGEECSLNMGRMGSPGDIPWKIHPNSSYNTFMFPSAPNSCDDLLKMQEVTLCIADRLAEIADTVRPVEWPVSGYIFPPQSEKDKFIVRDLAIYALANLGILDIFPNATSISGRQCSSSYAKAGSDPVFADSEKFTLFGPESETSEERYFSPLFPEIEVLPPELLAQSARARLVHKTHILRAGERLLKELVDKSVQADLAGAAFRRSKETDRVQGALLAWAGDRGNSDSNDYYNSISHALRVVAGRWEMAPEGPLGGVGGPDPRCGGLEFGDTFLGYGESDLKARVFSEEVRTKGQENAINLLEANGIVVPSNAFNSLGFPEIRQNIRKQILATSAHKLGYEVTPDFFSSSEYVKTGQGKVLGDVYDQISDADLAFAVRQSWNTYRMLTSIDGAASAASVQQDRAGLSKGDVPQFMGTAGVGLRDAIPRTDLLLDALARAGGISKKSQCNETNGLSDAQDASKTLRFAFQNVTAVAQTLQQGLLTIRESASEFNAEDSVNLAALAVAETEAWAGPGRVLGWSPSSGALPRRIDLEVVGFTPKDVGVSNTSAMPQEFALVWGAPWVAECAARVRKNCPENFEANYIAHPSNVSLSADLNRSNNTALRKQYATDGSLLRMSFRYTAGWPSNFVPKFDGVERVPSNNNEHLYVIQLHDPSVSANVGRVLGALSIKKADGVFALSPKVSTLPVSRFTSDITDRLLSVPRNWTGGSCQVGAPSPSSPDAYCVDRSVSRELFVPLENELTSDSDQYENSWKHYLQLARIAAERADQLGRELIDIGLQKDLRREAALEEVGKICGDFGSAQQASVVNGEIHPSKPSGSETPDGTNETISNCISSKKYDIVFTSEDPYENLSSEEATQRIKSEVLGCPSVGDLNPKTPHIFCNKDAIGHSGLNLLPTPTIAKKMDCGFITLGMKSLVKVNNGFLPNWMQKFSEDFNKDILQSSIQATRLVVKEDLSWTLTSSGTIFMDSSPNDLFWPGCRREGHSCPQEKENLFENFDLFFRRGSGSLGQFDGGAFSISDADNEAGFVRRRVEGALWILGSWSGYMPSGYFRTYVPALDWDYPGTNGTDRLPISTIYGFTAFDDTSGRLNFFDMNGNKEQDENQNILGITLPLSTWPGAFSGDYIPGEMSPWAVYLDAATHVGKYRMIPSSSSGHATKQDPFFKSSLMSSFLDMKGLSCRNSNMTTFEAGFSGSGNATLKNNVANWRLGGLNVKQMKPFGGGVTLELGALSTSTFGSNNIFVFNENGQSKLFLADAVYLGNKKINDVVPYKELGFYTDPQNPQNVYPFSEYSLYDRKFMYDHDDDCRDPSHSPYGSLKKSCAQYETNDINGFYLVTRRMLWPRVWSPGERIPLFINTQPPTSACDAATSLMQGAFLSCVMQQPNAGISIPEQPTISSVDDIPLLEAWVDTLRKAAERQSSSIYLENVPESVVSQFRSQSVASQGNTGTFGVLAADMGTSLEEIRTGWNSVAASISVIQNAIRDLNIQISIANINENISLGNLAVQRIQSEMTLAKELSNIITACAVDFGVEVISWNAASCLTQISYTAFAVSEIGKQQEIMNQQGSDFKELNASQVNAAFNNFDSVIVEQRKSIGDAMVRIRQAAFRIVSISNQLKSSELEASYALGKAAGGDFVRTSDGQEVVYPVNTVLRRQYDITKRRYENALKDAKYMAFVARRAIEQRIGIRLATIDTPVGPFEPPSMWADDVCNLQGIDYDQLRDKDFGVAGNSAFSGDNTAIDSFADRYVGDYVTKLENFVETYNITYPSHDGDDVAILSLRDDLLGNSATCLKETPNLLYYSSRLDQRDAAVDENSGETRGWLAKHCDNSNTNCVTIAPKEAVPSAPDGPNESGNAVYSWIRDIQAVNADGAGSETGAGSPNEGAGQGGTVGVTGLGPLPQNVYQTVHLNPGTYVLSWWDQRRDASGNCVTLPTSEPSSCTILEESETSAPYAVSVLDQGWVPISVTPVGVGIFEPAVAGWSPRRTISFKVTNEQDVSVSFAASIDGIQGSLLLAGIQLEQSASNSGSNGASVYIDTLSSRLYVSGSCASARTAEDVQKAFSYQCTAEGKCFYELIAPISINTEPIAKNNSRLNGKITAGNFNYRHLDVAVNLAGTGLINCENANGSSCYGSGYLEYTLAHDAYEAGILNYNGQQQCFSFGSASINHAKALAAERYITNPVSSADQSLLSQPSVTKTELRGRPLDGTYRFRIWDHPGLQWNRLEDIQFVLKYRYWSPIQKSK